MNDFICLRCFHTLKIPDSGQEIICPECHEQMVTYAPKDASGPRMAHFLMILRLPFVALQQHIEQELLENPVLEMNASADELALGAEWAPEITAPLTGDLHFVIDKVPKPENYGRYPPLNSKQLIRDNHAMGSSRSNVEDMTAEIIVEKNVHEEYEVRVVDGWRKISVNQRYSAMVREQNCDEKTREFLQRKLQSAQWLIEAIEQRRKTLARVAAAIMQHERAFLDKGPEFLKPVNVQEIAEQAEMDANTVMCAVENKWINTPHWTLALQSFFVEGKGTSEQS